MITIDFAKPQGIIRPLHGVNLGPLNNHGTLDLSAHHRELGIPFTRLHDCTYYVRDVADIHCIFRNFDADPTRAENYSFAETDDYIQSILNVGSQIVYRLGQSIEHQKRKYHVHPPKDFAKWAEICVRIIDHYNNGWADGFHHNIPYWEIWNEPDIGGCWTGTMEQYHEMYATAARAIKQQHPGVKVGGPTLAWISEKLPAFLKFCVEGKVPLDFLSFHTYGKNPGDLSVNAATVRKSLDEHGFARAEIHLNEWNLAPNWAELVGTPQQRRAVYETMGSELAASFVASALIFLQDSPVDVANFYDASTGEFGLFDRFGGPRKNFHALRAFKHLLDTPHRVSADGSNFKDGLAVCAGLSSSRQEATILVSNFKATEQPPGIDLHHLPWSGATSYEQYGIHRDADLALVKTGKLDSSSLSFGQPLGAPSVCLIKLRKGG